MKLLKLIFLLSSISWLAYSMEYEGSKKEKEEIEESYKQLSKEAREALEKALEEGISLKQLPLDIRKFLYLEQNEGETVDQRIRGAILDAYAQDDGEAIKELIHEAQRTKSNIAGHDFDTNDLIVDALKEGKYAAAKALIEMGPIDPFEYQSTKYYYAVMGNPNIPQAIKNELLDIIKKNSIHQKK